MRSSSRTGTGEDIDDFVVIHITGSYLYTAEKVWIERKKIQKLLPRVPIKDLHVPTRSAWSGSNYYVQKLCETVGGFERTCTTWSVR